MLFVQLEQRHALSLNALCGACACCMEGVGMKLPSSVHVNPVTHLLGLAQSTVFTQRIQLP